MFPFESRPLCPKCHSALVPRKYCPGAHQFLDGTPCDIDVEHLHYVCTVCDYDGYVSETADTRVSESSQENQ